LLLQIQIGFLQLESTLIFRLQRCLFYIFKLRNCLSCCLFTLCISGNEHKNNYSSGLFYLNSVIFLTDVLNWPTHDVKSPIYPRTSWIRRFFFSRSPLKAPNCLKSLKLAWRFVLTSCDTYQNPFTQEKILKFWQCRTKIVIYLTSSCVIWDFFGMSGPV
jgi:hypothetical protein